MISVYCMGKFWRNGDQECKIRQGYEKYHNSINRAAQDGTIPTSAFW